MKVYTGHVPFHQIVRDGTVMKKMLEGSRPPRPADASLLSDEIWKVIEMCWNQEPQDRPTAESVIGQLPLAGVVDDRQMGDDHLAPSEFRAENLGVVFDPAVDIILSSVLRSTRTNEVEPHAIYSHQPVNDPAESGTQNRFTPSFLFTSLRNLMSM